MTNEQTAAVQRLKEFVGLFESGADVGVEQLKSLLEAMAVALPDGWSFEYALDQVRCDLFMKKHSAKVARVRTRITQELHKDPDNLSECVCWDLGERHVDTSSGSTECSECLCGYEEKQESMAEEAYWASLADEDCDSCTERGRPCTPDGELE